MNLPQSNGRILQVTLWVLIGAAAFGGCGTGPSKTDWPAPVLATGRVTANGKPLDLAQVYLAPESGTPGPGASGTTDADGRFSLFTISPDGKLIEGAIPGKYRASVSRLVRPDGSAFAPDSRQTPIESGGVESVASQYTDANRSKLLATVSSTGQSILLEVQLSRN